MTTVTNTAGLSAAYTYDVLGNRIAKKVNGTVTRFVWHGGQVAYETTGSGTLQLAYQWGLETDDLVGIHSYTTNANYYVVQDALRSVRGLVNRDGTWEASWRYKAYGAALDSAGTSPITVRFRWAGAQYDAETGFYFLRSRYYDPASMVFTQEDKAGSAGGMNLYAYANGDPVDGRDPGGTDWNPIEQYDPWSLIAANESLGEPSAQCMLDGALALTCGWDAPGVLLVPDDPWRDLDELRRFHPEYFPDGFLAFGNGLGLDEQEADPGTLVASVADSGKTNWMACIASAAAVGINGASVLTVTAGAVSVSVGAVAGEASVLTWGILGGEGGPDLAAASTYIRLGWRFFTDEARNWRGLVGGVSSDAARHHVTWKSFIPIIGLPDAIRGVEQNCPS